ncbi:MAG: hypothetical protein AAFX01_03995 [Cyanobacteria bacterium J06638_28]
MVMADCIPNPVGHNHCGHALACGSGYDRSHHLKQNNANSLNDD